MTAETMIYLWLGISAGMSLLGLVLIAIAQRMK